jgi:hypothetical protein
MELERHMMGLEREKQTLDLALERQTMELEDAQVSFGM